MGAIDLDRLLDEIFAAIPETPATNGERGAAEIVRKNRRARARQRIRDAFEARGPYPIPVERRSEARTLVERWAQKGFVDAYPDADTFEERCASERAVLEAAARGDETERFAAAERAYREDVVRRHGFIEIRGLQLSARVYQALDMVYVPLHVEERAEASAAAKHVDPTASSGVETIVDRAKKSVRKAVAETPSGGPAARKKGRGEGSPKAAKVGADGGRSTAKTGVAAKGSKVSARVAPAKQDPGKHASGAATPSVEAIASVLRSIERSRVPVMRALQSHNRLLLLGGPGSGKSTLMAYLAVRAARGDLREETGWKANPIPFLIAARAFREGPIAASDLARAAGAETWFFEHALSQHPVLILMDGLDEAKPEVATLVLGAVTLLLDAHSTARAVISARPSGSPTGEEPIPPGFSSARLTPMIPDEVGTFVDRWCLAAEVSLGKSKAVAESDARAAAEDLKERIRARGAIEKLAQTPLLCSVICVVHRFLGQRIPARRVALYEAITNVLLYEWDRAKFPETPDSPLAQLDAQAKRALLSRLARAMHEERAIEWPVERVIASFEKQLPDLGRPAEEAAQLVAHIRDRHGVLVERSPGMFAFSHLTFQEYLTAMEMVRRREYGVLLERYKDRWWHEAIVLAAGFPEAEVKRLIRGLLVADAERISSGIMLAAQCAETAIELPAALRTAIEAQIATVIPPKSPQALGVLWALGDIATPVLVERLATANANGKAAILMAFTDETDSSAAVSVCRLLKDPRRTTDPIPLSSREMFHWQPTVAECAAFAVGWLLRGSAKAYPHFLGAMVEADASGIGMLRSIRRVEKGTDLREQLGTLLRRYDESHPTAPVSASPSRRAARSG